MNKPIKFVFAVLAALGSAAVMAFVLSWIEINHELSIYSFSVWYIIPVGAVGCGLVAASGYLVACRLLHLRPDNMMIVLPVITAIGTFVGTNYLSYKQFEVFNGEKVSSIIGFGEYFKIIITESGYGGIDRVGGFGYVLALLQIAGFAAGGVLVQRKLETLTFCSHSGRFMKKTETVTLPFNSSKEYADLVSPAHDLAKAGKISDIRSIYAEKRESADNVKKPMYRSTAKFYQCDDCQLEHVVISGQMRQGNKWADAGSSPASPNSTLVGQPIFLS